MNIYLKILLVTVSSFALTIALGFPVRALMRRLKAGQTILGYVDKHEGKSGTPTMGGVMFLVAVTIITAAWGGMEYSFATVSVATMLAYGLLGFLDDYIKVRYKHNQGLKAYQKIIGQAGIAIIVSVFCYRNSYISSEIRIPFTTQTWDMGMWYIPFCIILFIAVSNAVNLTDGLDGLVAKSACSNCVILTAALLYILAVAVPVGDIAYRGQLGSLAVFTAALGGALCAFVWFNANPASIFMGDTGSLAIGGALACITVFSKNPLLNFFIGIMYVVSCISVIVQVLVYKTRGRRVFLMAPFHHHLEYKGIKESKIVTYYTLITTFAGIVGLISVMAWSYL